MDKCPCKFKRALEEEDPQSKDTVDEIFSFGSFLCSDNPNVLYKDGGLSSQPALFYELSTHLRQVYAKQREKDMEQQRKESELKKSGKETVKPSRK